MARLYADENFRYAVVEHLRVLGHDVLTVQETGQQGSSDSQVLSFATTQQRATLTFNRWHFVLLHSQVASHAGIIVCTDEDDAVALADRIHQTLQPFPALDNHLIRVDRPP